MQHADAIIEFTCIPDLEFNLFAVDRNHACTKLNANSEIVHGLEALVGEL